MNEEKDKVERLEQRVAELEQKLEDAHAEFETFAHSAAHDLRSPLRAISGFCYVLQEDYADQLGSEGADYLNRIKDSTKRMNDLIDRFVGLANVGRAAMRRSWVDMTTLAREVGHELSSEKTELTVAEDLSCEGDPALMRTVLENLLSNAYKFSGKQDQPKVEVGRTADGAFFVRDNGVGFDMEHARMLFKPFQRLHAQTEYPGSGLGLAIVQRILARHGGEIWTESEPNRGATFYFKVA